MNRIIALAVLFAASTAVCAETPQEVFEKRILPIFKSPNPSSCVQCHLSGVDLKDYLLPSARDTFLSLRDQKLIDLDNIDKSKILDFIQKGKEDKAKATAIHQANRAKEYEAFVGWLKACAADAELRNAPALDATKTAKPALPREVIRHARQDRLLASFENTIWSMRFRCMSCHTEGTPGNIKNVAKWGEQVAWFKKDGPEATLNYLLSSKLIDWKNPEKSLLLTKPLNQVKHEGGIKIEVGDLGYKAIRSFLDDVVKIKSGGYPTPASLPKPNTTATFGSEIWIKLTNTPPAWGDHLLQVNVYAWDEKKGAFDSEPIASTDRKVSGKGAVFQHTLTMQAAVDSERAQNWKKAKAALPRGKYLVKVYVDSKNMLAKDWQTILGDADYVGKAEITADWREGYGAMTVIDAKKIAK